VQFLNSIIPLTNRIVCDRSLIKLSFISLLMFIILCVMAQRRYMGPDAGTVGGMSPEHCRFPLFSLQNADQRRVIVFFCEKFWILNFPFPQM
jgi:hypothetical protein